MKIGKTLVMLAIMAMFTNVVSAVDTIPPASVSGLKNVSYAQNYINWTWSDPSDSDFSKVMVYINGKFKTNVTKGKQYYNSTGLSYSTTYKIGTRTVDSSGNINQTWVNSSAKTAPDTIPPNSITNLKNISIGSDHINWAWTNPPTDFSKVMIYINGVFKTNTSNKYYNATNLSPYTNYEIGTHTVDKSGNINQTWVNNTAMTAPPDTIPPDSITNLHVEKYTSGYITWAWTDPTNSDFDHVDIYIDGVFKTKVPIGIRSYTVVGLNSYTNYEIGTHTVDTSGNVNNTWKNDTQRTDNKPGIGIRFITIGDTHITSNTSNDQYYRFTRAINYINNMTDVDFIVEMGDIVDSGSDATYIVAKSIIDRLNISHKPYYVAEGNHGSGAYFIKYFGPDEHIENFPDINGYQLIFPGYNKSNNTWSFNYSLADKDRPTIIFNHGQVQPKPGGTSCIYDWGSYYSYACSMRPYVDNFTNLLGYYDGHVHTGTNQIINGTLYVTEDNLGGNGPASDYIGYTEIYGGLVNYTTTRY